MYRTFDPPPVCDLLGIDPTADLPAGLIVHGCYDMPAAALIYLLDNLIAERHLLDNTQQEHERVLWARELVQEVALEVVAAAAT